MRELKELYKMAGFGASEIIPMVFTAALFIGWLFVMPW